ncbi:serine hydrolase domain-containing protein [Flagellimonas lutaonensis]|uniref:Alkaline D-peptidase n=1 Tax=Flagellimonas lutaonensis TaxID=516051 RepID=A0A0D5YPQ1_9FLAO|nr:serine hydrolase domain-containing protein [Allomuricauda lutaonensis]AKA34290.1 alkaline D-peptidase [Allomuricauda lutaonensis]
MKDKLTQTELNRIVHRAARKRNIYGAVFYVSTENKGIDIISASRNFETTGNYYIASINKLFVSAIILSLYFNKKLDLKDKILRYLPDKFIHRLHYLNGHDHSKELTVLHLISHTSGLPCYLADKQPDGIRAIKNLEAGIDQRWDTKKVIEVVKTMKPHFPPGKKGKAKYADTNHQILGQIIENITGEPIRSVLTQHFKKLDLTNTYVCDKSVESEYVPIRYESRILDIPAFLSSTGTDIISNAEDQMIFLKAFFNGHFFPKNRIGELKKWNNIFFPFKYGIGLQKFYMPRIFNPFHPLPEIIGHCGSTGSIAFHIPELKAYVTGTVNQQAAPQVAFRTLIKIVNKLR